MGNNQKKNRQMRYPLDKLYYGTVDEYDCIIYEMIQDHKSRYIELIALPSYAFIDRTLKGNFKISKSLKEEIMNNQIDVCLITKEGKDKQSITLEEITNILKLINLLEHKSFAKLDSICLQATNYICDLLGVNVLSNPSSTLEFKDTEEIAIPFFKVKRLKELLFDYIKISLILDGVVTIKNDDYRIVRALNGCKIKKSEFENEFSITVNSNGEFNIECENIAKGFQKPFKKKHE